MGTAMKYLVPDRVKPSLIILTSGALWRSGSGRSGTRYPYGNSGRQRVKSN